MPRTAEISRTTAETAVTAALNLDGTGRFEGGASVPFLDHMLAQTARHGLVDITLTARGDTDIDCHHTVEDIGIVLGQALARALGDKAGIRRYGCAVVPMDEALARCALDISGRPYLHWNVPFTAPRLGALDTEMVGEFFRALCTHAGFTLHIELLHGANNHHIAEAIFKAFGRALREAAEPDGRAAGVPSTKGAL